MSAGMRQLSACALLATIAAAAATAAPPFCRGSPCPPYSVESTTPSYEVRLYESVTWASINVTGADSRVELALAKASVPLERYIKGKNAEGVTVASGKPVAVCAAPKNKFTELEPEFAVSFFLPDVTAESAPKPEYKNISVHSTPGDTQVYVYQFGGFATTGSVLSSAAKLATALEEDKLSYETGFFFFMVYDAPWRLTGRHNEIWMLPKWPQQAAV